MFSKEQVEQMLMQAWRSGFMTSAEGINGEVPRDDSLNGAIDAKAEKLVSDIIDGRHTDLPSIRDFAVTDSEDVKQYTSQSTKPGEDLAP